MPGQVEEQVLQVGLANFQSVEAGQVGGKYLQAGVHVVGLDFDDALRFDDPVFNRGQLAAHILQR